MTFTLQLSPILCLSTDAVKFALQHGAIQTRDARCEGPIRELSRRKSGVLRCRFRLRNSRLQTNLTQGCRNKNKRFYSNERSFNQVNFTTARRLTRPTPLE